jgi:hypothetical protein
MEKTVLVEDGFNDFEITLIRRKPKQSLELFG